MLHLCHNRNAKGDAMINQSKKKQRRWNIDIDPEIHRQIKIAAATKGVLLKEVFEEILNEWISLQKGTQ